MILAGLALAVCVWAAWPASSAPAAPAPERPAAAGPAPVRSELETTIGYEQETPEELGAAPLPGAVLTPAPPLAVR
jgi:hypothetical protein